MNAAIANILKDKLTDLPWLERFGGMVTTVTRPVFASNTDGAQVVAGYQVYPVACDVNLADCWETGTYKMFEPDSNKSAIAFFVDNGGCVFRGIEGPKNSFIKLTFDLRFLMWLNIPRLGPELTTGDCNISGRIAPYVMAKLWGTHSAFGKFNGNVEEEMYQAVEVTSLSQMPKSPAMFQPFTFATEGEKRGLFMYPYDYLGLRIGGTFTINHKCLPGLRFVPESEYCITP